MPDKAACAAIRGLVRGLYQAGVITSIEQREAVAGSIWSEAERYLQSGDTPRAETLHRLVTSVSRDLRIGD